MNDNLDPVDKLISGAPDRSVDRTEDEQALHAKLMAWYTQARETEAVNRYQQAIDHDFYDGLQWAEDDAADLNERGQAAIVINKIKPAVDWLLGTEKRSRVDFKVLPRAEDDIQTAHVKTQLLKYLGDVNNVVFHRSRAFADAVIGGVGWLEDGVHSDPEDEPLFSRYEDWRNVWYDPLSVERDLSDARFIFRSKFIDLDVAIAMFPDKVPELKAAATAIESQAIDEYDDFYYLGSALPKDTHQQLSRRTYLNGAYVNNRRDRVRLIEFWHRVPANIQVVKGGFYDGYSTNQLDETVIASIQGNDTVSIVDAVRMQVRVTVMTESEVLASRVSPYKHNRFPFTPIWGYRRKRDNAPYGVVRNIRDVQEDLNKRASKALFILSTNQIIAHESAASDWDEVRAEVARPDGVILLDGAPDAKFELNQDKQLAQQHIALMEQDARMILDVSGVTSENLGLESNAISGKAVQARQTQGSVVTAELFDNLRFAIQLQGETQLSLVEQFITEEKTIRLTGAKGGTDFLSMNTPRFDQASGEWRWMNDITSTKADFVVDEQDYSGSIRQAMFNTMQELVTRLDPEMAMQVLDLVFEYSDVPGKDEIVARIRQINGHADPKAPRTPEEQAQFEQRQQEQQAQQQMQMEQMQLQLEEMRAKVKKLNADAELAMAKAQAELQPQQQGPDPNAQLELQAQQMHGQLALQKERNDADIALQREKAQADWQLKQQDMAHKHAMSQHEQLHQQAMNVQGHQAQREDAQNHFKLKEEQAKHDAKLKAQAAKAKPQPKK